MAKMMELHQGSGVSYQNEFEKEAQDNRSRMQRLRDEAVLNSMDEVKEMNKMVAYAKAAYIRERQIEERKAINGIKYDEEKRKDLMMEVERAKGLAVDEEAAIKRKATAIVGKEVIIGQIHEREFERMKEKEQLAKEGEDMLRKLKQREIEEIEEAERKVIRQREIFEQMIEENKSQVEIREIKGQEEKAENERIMQYILKKQEKEDNDRMEKLRLRQEKEHETNKLREKQEKAQDRNKELDELLARRAVEKSEREFRKKEADKASKLARMYSSIKVGIKMS